MHFHVQLFFCQCLSSLLCVVVESHLKCVHLRLRGTISIILSKKRGKQNKSFGRHLPNMQEYNSLFSATFFRIGLTCLDDGNSKAKQVVVFLFTRNQSQLLKVNYCILDVDVGGLYSDLRSLFPLFAFFFFYFFYFYDRLCKVTIYIPIN